MLLQKLEKYFKIIESKRLSTLRRMKAKGF